MGHQPHERTASGLKPPCNTSQQRPGWQFKHTWQVCVNSERVRFQRGQQCAIQIRRLLRAHRPAPANSCADPAGKKISHHIQMNVTFKGNTFSTSLSYSRQESESWADPRENLKKESFHGQILIYVGGKGDGWASNVSMLKRKLSPLQPLLLHLINIVSRREGRRQI